MLGWFAVMVKPRFERSVALALRAKGYEEYLPLVSSKRAWSDRCKTIQMPLFPRYVFCRFPFDARVPILNTPGVWQIVSLGGKPSPIPDHEIAALRRIVDSPVRAEPCEYLAAGQVVRVTRGPLAGLEGLLLDSKGNGRIVVSVTLLRRSLAAEVERDAVIPVMNLRMQPVRERATA